MQNTLTTIDKTKFIPFSVGFDDLFDRLFEMDVNSSGYPPYNIIKKDDYNYVIEMAIAGFNKDQIELELADGELSIKSKIKDLDDNSKKSLIHQGISHRNFVRKFTLSDEIHIKNAELKDGMLRIKLEKIIPDNKKPKLITIK
ncbi:MAG: Hsp20 family protein [Pseudomonadota bacterium]|nr:Hsp20 family protein [Pseudomonadota bacterium]